MTDRDLLVLLLIGGITVVVSLIAAESESNLIDGSVIFAALYLLYRIGRNGK